MSTLYVDLNGTLFHHAKYQNGIVYLFSHTRQEGYAPYIDEWGGETSVFYKTLNRNEVADFYYRRIRIGRKGAEDDLYNGDLSKWDVENQEVLVVCGIRSAYDGNDHITLNFDEIDYLRVTIDSKKYKTRFEYIVTKEELNHWLQYNVLDVKY